MSDEQLTIKIGGDTKDLTKAYEDVAKQTEGLSGKLDSIAKISGLAFAALTAQVGLSLKAFSDASLSSASLTNALQNQGIYTDDLKDSYREYAEQVSELTGIETSELTAAQAVAQRFLGQIPVTKELTQAIADLSVQQGVSLTEAATEMAKAIGNGTGMLLRQGLQFASTDTEAERYQKTLDFVKMKSDGMAAAANDATFGVKGLETAFKENEEELGSRFAPIFTDVVRAVTDFIRPAKDSSEEVTNLKTAFIAVGLVLSGIGVALPLVVNGFLALRAAIVATTLSIPVIGLIALAVTGITFAVVELAAHWQTASVRIQDIVKGLVTFVSGAFKGLGSVLSGAFHLDTGKIKEGLAEIQEAFKSGVAKATEELPKATEKAGIKQNEIAKLLADKETARKRQEAADEKTLQETEDELILLQMQHASAERIKAQEQEVKTLKEIIATHDQEKKELLRNELSEEWDITEKQRIDDMAKEETFGELAMETKRNLAERFRKFDDDTSKQELSKIKSSIKTREIVERDAYTQELKDMIAAHNKFLEEQNKYGTAYAAMNYAMHTAEVQGFKQATGELVQLTNSKNSTLKQIGKIATIANIVIKTAESAMNIFAGFSAIPIIGPALGLAGAAAAIAYGAEQIGNVTSAQKGGIIPGTGSGDIMPAMLEPGELVAPRQNFDEVVNSVAAARAGDKPGHAEESGHATVQLSLVGDLAKIVEAKIIERQRIGISLFKTAVT